MKILIIHSGKVNEELKSAIINKIKVGKEDVKTRSSRLDFLKYFFEDFPKNSERVSLVIFDSISGSEIDKAKKHLPVNENFYLLRIGMPEDTYADVHENIVCIKGWSAEKFFNFIHSKKDGH